MNISKKCIKVGVLYMYKLFSSISYIVRFYLAYLTIEKVSIFKSTIANYFWGEVVSIYVVFMVISYFITGLFYEKDSMPAEIGVIIYFLVYCVILFFYWLILLLLTSIGILPISM